MFKNIINIFITNYPKRFLLIFFGSFISSLLDLLSIASFPVLIGFLSTREKFISKIDHEGIKNYLLNIEFNELIILTIFLIFVLFLIKNIFFLSLLIFEQSTIYKIKTKLSNLLYKNYINSPYEFHLEYKPTLLGRNIITEVERSTNSLVQSLSFFKELLIIILLVCFLLFANFKMSILIISILTLAVGGFYLFFRRQILNWSKENLNLRSRILQTVNETFGSIKDIKIFRKESLFSSFFKNSINLLEKNGFKFQLLVKAPRIYLEVVCVILFLSIMFFFQISNINFLESLPILSFLAIALIRLMPAYNGISNGLNIIKNNSPSVKLIVQEIQNLNKKIKKTNIKETSKNLNFENIHFDNISYTYPNSKKEVLKKIYLKINKGEKVGFTGKTGCGKSTLIQILLGLLYPKKGKVKIDGTNILDILDDWRDNFGYVSQNVYLLDASIEKNIAFTFDEKDIDHQLMDNAIKNSELSNFINELPNGKKSLVGTDGIKLSGGQRQRIGIARALYKKPKILVLDESTSSLDNQTENLVINNLNNLKNKPTLIFIAHRLSTLSNCNNIFLLKDGSIIDSGKLEQLKTRNNLEDLQNN